MFYMFFIYYKWFMLNIKEVFNGWNLNFIILWLFVFFFWVFMLWKRFLIFMLLDVDDFVVYIILIMNK